MDATCEYIEYVARDNRQRGYSSLESANNIHNYATKYFVFWVVNKLGDRELQMIVIKVQW